MFYIIALIGIIVAGLVFAIIGHVFFRSGGEADARYKFAIASLFSLPLLLVLLLTAIIQLALRLKIDTSAFSEQILVFTIYSTLAALTPIGWVLYAMSATFTILAWPAVRSRAQKILLGLYMATVTLYIVCNIAWFATKQEMTFP